jgi:glycopeptide antibiotics resistance protein
MVDTNDVNTVRFVMGLTTVLLFASIWFGIVAFLRTKKKKTPLYLLFFTIFYLYIYKVLDYTLLQFQSLLLLKHFAPALRMNGVAARDSINLIPLVNLTAEDWRTSLLNILLMMPFGFGLPFITNFTAGRIIVLGALFSIAIELLQLLTGVMAGMTFRIADINDVIFNTVGVAAGYVILIGIVRIYRRMSHERRQLRTVLLETVAERVSPRR